MKELTKQQKINAIDKTIEDVKKSDMKSPLICVKMANVLNVGSTMNIKPVFPEFAEMIDRVGKELSNQYTNVWHYKDYTAPSKEFKINKLQELRKTLEEPFVYALNNSDSCVDITIGTIYRLTSTPINHINFNDDNGDLRARSFGDYTLLTQSEYDARQTPSYVKCVVWECGDSFKSGSIYPTNHEGYVLGDNYVTAWAWNFHGYDNTNIKFIASTEEAYNEQQGNIELEELLAEANKRYPVGTKFRAARGEGMEYIVHSGHRARWDEEHDNICLESAGNGTVYHEGIWAEIIEEKVVREMTVAEISKELGIDVKIVK